MGAKSQAGMHHAGLHGTKHTGKGLKKQKKNPAVPCSSCASQCSESTHALLRPGGLLQTQQSPRILRGPHAAFTSLQVCFEAHAWGVIWPPRGYLHWQSQLPGRADVSPREGAAPPTPIRQVTLPGWDTGGPGEQSGCLEAQMESNPTDAEVTGRKTARLGPCLIFYF